MENQKNNNQLQIELKDEVAQGTYANLAICGIRLYWATTNCPSNFKKVY